MVEQEYDLRVRDSGFGGSVLGHTTIRKTEDE